jgi:hypothetical protein
MASSVILLVSRQRHLPWLQQCTSARWASTAAARTLFSTTTNNTSGVGTTDAAQQRQAMTAGRLKTKAAMKPGQVFVRAGLPMLLFTIGASLVVASAVEGKQREREVFTGRNLSK